MINIKFIFPNKDSWISFFLLLFGTLIIWGSATFTLLSYLFIERYTPSQQEMVSQIVRVIAVSHSFPLPQSKAILKSLDNRGFKATISAVPGNDVEQMAVLDIGAIRSIVNSDPYHFKMAWPIINNRWLVVQGIDTRHPWLNLGFISIAIVLFLALFCLFAWSIKRLALPVASIGEAAKRFGLDVQAPALAVQGPDEVQQVVGAFNEMQNRIRRLLHDRTQMLMAISHDLRTPITRLKLRIEYLKDSDQYERAAEDLDQMDQMINSILSFARDYMSEESSQVFDLQALLLTLCDDLSDAGNDVRFSGPDHRIAFYGRLTALKRAFANLIDNGVKYGGHVFVLLRDHPDFWRIQVQDAGPGIPECERERVFSPFYRLDPARCPNVTGTGLGLSVSRDIVRAAGGDIKLMDASGGGLLVQVDLPKKSV